MRLRIDSDVLLDFIGERESTAAAWVKVDTQEATPSCSCAIFLMYPGSGATR